MKPFDLQKAIEGHPLVTRDGRKVTEFLYFKTVNTLFPCAAIVSNMILLYTKNGYMHNESCSQSDLFLAPETKWVNLYLAKIIKDNIYCSKTYNSQDEAKANIESERNDLHYLKTIEIEIP